jgi:oxalate decarboxylase/phosphoglucose isomerase-like protein (cupin superfamily)
MDRLFAAEAPGRVQGASVTFEPGARTAWHTHPLGQTIIVTSGLGRAQREGGPVEEIRPGDVVWFEPGEKHWHGASPDVAMTHIAIQEGSGRCCGNVAREGEMRIMQADAAPCGRTRDFPSGCRRLQLAPLQPICFGELYLTNKDLIS